MSLIAKFSSSRSILSSLIAAYFLILLYMYEYLFYVEDGLDFSALSGRVFLFSGPACLLPHTAHTLPPSLRVRRPSVTAVAVIDQFMSLAALGREEGGRGRDGDGGVSDRTQYIFS